MKPIEAIFDSLKIALPASFIIIGLFFFVPWMISLLSAYTEITLEVISSNSYGAYIAWGSAFLGFLLIFMNVLYCVNMVYEEGNIRETSIALVVNLVLGVIIFPGIYSLTIYLIPTLVLYVFAYCVISIFWLTHHSNED